MTSPPGDAVLPHPSRSRRREAWAFGTSAIVHALLLVTLPECGDATLPAADAQGRARIELVQAAPPSDADRATALEPGAEASDEGDALAHGDDALDGGAADGDAAANGDGTSDADAAAADAEGSTGGARTDRGGDGAALPPAALGGDVSAASDAGGASLLPIARDGASSGRPVVAGSSPASAADHVDRARAAAEAAPPSGRPANVSAPSGSSASAAPGRMPASSDEPASARTVERAATAAVEGPPAAAATTAALPAHPSGPAPPAASGEVTASEHADAADPTDAVDAPDPTAPTPSEPPLPTASADLDASAEVEGLTEPEATPESEAVDAAAPVDPAAAPQVSVPPEVASIPPDAATLFAALAALERAAALQSVEPHPPEPKPPAEQWLTWARVSRSAAEVDAPASALIAAWNVHVDMMAGSVVTADAEGPRRSGADVNEPLPYQVGVEAPVRPPKEAMGESPALTKPQPAPSGGGPAAPAGGVGARAAPGRRDGSQAVAADAGHPGSAGSLGSAGSPGSPGSAGGAAGSAGGAVWAPPFDPVGDWHPAVGRVRVVEAHPSTASSAIPATPASPALAASAAVAPRAARPARASRASKASPPPAPPTSPTEGPQPPARIPDPVDWMDDLAELFGWGREPSDDYAPRLAEEGRQGSLATESTSPQTVVDDLELSAAPAVSARQTPLGQYLEAVDDAVRERWRSFPLSPEQMAFGTTTFAAVEFTVLRSGRVEGIRLTRRSRDAVLDQLALAAIPKRLPRIPVEVGLDHIDHRIHLWYRSSADATP